MYNILAAIGLITILAILFFLYLNSIDRKKEEEKDNYDLAKYSDKCENIEKNASSVDEVHKQIRQVLSDPKERLEAETRRRQYQKELDDLNEERHKEYVSVPIHINMRVMYLIYSQEHLRLLQYHIIDHIDIL